MTDLTDKKLNTWVNLTVRWFQLPSLSFCLGVCLLCFNFASRAKQWQTESWLVMMSTPSCESCRNCYSVLRRLNNLCSNKWFVQRPRRSLWLWWLEINLNLIQQLWWAMSWWMQMVRQVRWQMLPNVFMMILWEMPMLQRLLQMWMSQHQRWWIGWDGLWCLWIRRQLVVWRQLLSSSLEDRL